MALWLNDRDLQIHVGDCRDVLRGLPDESVHCVVTSPPYWNLRDYGTGLWEGGDESCDHLQPVSYKNSTLGASSGGRTEETHARSVGAQAVPYLDLCGKCGARRVDNQLGLESTPEEYVANMVDVFREVRRVLRHDGTCWLNLGDTYSTGGKGISRTEKQASNKGSLIPGSNTPPPGLKPKELVGIPWRTALALQADGWWLRSDIIWAKNNPMPESVKDRPTKSHEYLFLLSKSAKYFYDHFAIMEPAEWARWGDQTNSKHEGSESAASWIKPATKAQLAKRGKQHPDRKETNGSGGFYDSSFESGFKNSRSVWTINTEAYSAAHFATFPTELPTRCIKAGTSEKGCCPVCGAPWVRVLTEAFDYVAPKMVGWEPGCPRTCPGHVETPVPCTVMDPFGGSGTTGFVARELGRRSVLVELSTEYAQLILDRTQQLSLLS